MDLDLVSIIRKHRSRNRYNKKSGELEIRDQEIPIPKVSEFPDVLFDEILVNFKLQRIDILVLIYLYRKVWCLPNIYSKYGIGPILPLQEVSKNLKVDFEELQKAIRKLESLDLIETIRVGQYFIRKYLTEKNDFIYGQSYDDF